MITLYRITSEQKVQYFFELTSFERKINDNIEIWFRGEKLIYRQEPQNFTYFELPFQGMNKQEIMITFYCPETNQITNVREDIFQARVQAIDINSISLYS
jgi:hypothetical protein